VTAVAVILWLQGLLFLLPAILVVAKVWQLGFADTMNSSGIHDYLLRRVAPGLLAATLATIAASGILLLQPRMRIVVLILEPAFILLTWFHLGGHPLITSTAWIAIILLFTPRLKETFGGRADRLGRY
jgi:hypothetical protein